MDYKSLDLSLIPEFPSIDDQTSLIQNQNASNNASDNDDEFASLIQTQGDDNSFPKLNTEPVESGGYSSPMFFGGSSRPSSPIVGGSSEPSSLGLFDNPLNLPSESELRARQNDSSNDTKIDENSVIRDPYPLSDSANTFSDTANKEDLQYAQNIKRAHDVHSEWTGRTQSSPSFGIKTSTQNLLKSKSKLDFINNLDFIDTPYLAKGEYKGLPTMSDGTGTGAVVNVKVGPDQTHTVKAVCSGFGYKKGDMLIIHKSFLPGAPNNAFFRLEDRHLASNSTEGCYGIKLSANNLLNSMKVKNKGKIKPNTKYTSLPAITKGNGGSGAQFDVAFGENKEVTQVTVKRPGYGYKVGNTLSVRIPDKKQVSPKEEARSSNSIQLTFELKSGDLIAGQDDEIIELYTSSIKSATEHLKTIPRLPRIPKVSTEDRQDQLSNLISKAYFAIGTIYERRNDKDRMIDNYKRVIQIRRQYRQARGTDDFMMIKAQARIGNYLLPKYISLKGVNETNLSYDAILDQHPPIQNKTNKWTEDDAVLLAKLVAMREAQLERTAAHLKLWKFITRLNEKHNFFGRKFTKGTKQTGIFLRKRRVELDPRDFKQAISEYIEFKARKKYQKRPQCVEWKEPTPKRKRSARSKSPAGSSSAKASQVLIAATPVINTHPNIVSDDFAPLPSRSPMGMLFNTIF